MRNGVLAGVVISLAAACTPAPVELNMECAPVGEPSLLRATAGLRGWWSLGMMDGRLLFTFLSWSGFDDEATEAWAQWYGPELGAESDSFVLGRGRALISPTWVRHDGALWAQLWAEQGTDGLNLPIRYQVSIWQLAPGEKVAERFVAPDLGATSVFDRTDLLPISVGAPTITAGADGRAPAVVAHGRPFFGLGVIPASCPGMHAANMTRLEMFDRDSAVIDLSGPEPCALDGSVWSHNARLVALRDGGAGVFFRLGQGIGQGFIHYSRIGPDLTLLDTPPVRVEETTIARAVPGGYQPQAVALGSGTLLFTNRDPESGYNVCQELRLVEPDGSSPRLAPYQMPCLNAPDAHRRGEANEVVSAWVVLSPLASGHAAIAYGETVAGVADGVFLHTIDAAGRRSSEIMRVTPPVTSATSEDFQVQMVSEGDDVIVAWRDSRPDTPGYYARRYHCGPLPE